MNNLRSQWFLSLAVAVVFQLLVVASVVTSSRFERERPEDVEVTLRHATWERLVKRSASVERHRRSTGRRYIDDTSHIVNVQDYYRSVFSEGWEEPKGEKEQYDLLYSLEAIIQDEDRGSSESTSLGVHSKPIKGRYLVMFQSEADDYVLDKTMAILQKAHRSSRGRIRASDLHPLRHVGKGFAATLNYKAVKLMDKHPLISHIEVDTALKRSAAIVHDSSASYTSSQIPWNLVRITTHQNKLNNQFHPDGNGEKVNIYVIDTGVRYTHKEFEGRVRYAGFDAVDYLTGTNNKGQDCNGHGTHCAAIAAGKFFGVAKKANIYNMRALNCQGVGAVSGIVMGMDKIIKMASKSSNRTIITQSLGVKKSPTLNGAIKRAVEANIMCVGASGNQASYSCNFSPASAKVGIAVGAVNKRDQVTIFTNTGECTDIMAPGVQIKSATKDCDTCSKTLSGTSMAAPHVTGAAAILLSKFPTMSAKKLKEEILKQATEGLVKMTLVASNRASVTPNKLLYVKSSSSNNNNAQARIQGSSRP